MQIIKTSNITAVEAMSNEDAIYPKENCISKQPQQIAKSDSTESKIILSVGSFTNVAFFNVSADSGKLEIVDHDSGVPILNRSDISVTDTNTFNTVAGDFTVFADGDKFILYGFDTAGNNAEFTVSGTPTANNMDVVGTPLTAEIAGNDITVVRFNDSDKALNEDISFSYCKTYTDYFSGNAILLDQYYKELSDNYTNATVQVTITGTLPSIGLIFAGQARSYGTSQYGTSKNIVDHSIFQKTINGALNQVSRAVNINASVSVSCTRQQEVALENLFKYNNADYKVFMIKYDSQDGLLASLLLYGKVESKPRASWQLPDTFGYTIDITSIQGYE